MEISETIFRGVGIFHLMLWLCYWFFRIFFTIGANSTVVFLYRVCILLIEFLSSISSVSFLFIRISKPWSQKIFSLSLNEFWEITEKNEQNQETSGANELTPLNSTESSVSEDANEFFQDIKLKKPLDDENSIMREILCKWSKTKIRMEKYLLMETTTVSRVSNNLVSQNLITRCDEFQVHILIPCYQESLEIVSQTCLAALSLMHYQPNIHIYLCDDGRDEEKREWVEAVAESCTQFHYVSRPESNKLHGKAGNLNYALTQVIFAKHVSRSKQISQKALVAVFDADMMCLPTFLRKLIPCFVQYKNIAMVQTPQTFHNVSLSADFFDVHNVNFFSYLLPAMNKWNSTTCCGTNFIVRAKCLQAVGWFPTESVTEDLLLAMKLLERKWNIHYSEESLVIGEAPKDLRQIFQQRSRWAKGTLQICLAHNPLWNTKLPFMTRVTFFCGFWSYISSAFFNPCFVLVNMLAIVFGLFPIQRIGYAGTLLCVFYYSTLYVVNNFTPVPVKHIVSLWVVGKLGHIFSFLSLKAMFNVIKSQFISKAIVFKATKKTGVKESGSRDNDETQENRRDSSHSDIWFHCIMCLGILSSIVYGLSQFSHPSEDDIPEIQDSSHPSFQKRNIKFFLIIWMFQFLIAYSLPIIYSILPDDDWIQTKALRYMLIFDCILSLFLVCIPILLFKTDILLAYPNASSPLEFPPTDVPLWIVDDASQRKLGEYIYHNAVKQQIPVIVIQMRPSCSESYAFCVKDGSETWTEYSRMLGSISGSIKEKRFPAVVILEPGWIQEAFPLVNSTAYNRQQENVLQNLKYKEWTFDETSSTSWQVDKFYRGIGAFVRVASKFPKNVFVYLDIGDPWYLQSSQFIPTSVLASHQALRSFPFRGVVLNTESYFLSQDISDIGHQLYNQFGWRFIEDSSRNGGPFSSREWNEIDACKRDPPKALEGRGPSWDKTDRSGRDGNLWITNLGVSDGRLYRKGEAHKCLRDHSIECNDRCPLELFFPDFSHQYRAACTCE